MPKVSPAHYDKKKQEILDAAKRVCSRKPIYNVAMRDIVIEAGMSQGGVYKYFSNIDEVFVALLNQGTLSYRIKDDVNSLLDTNKDPLVVLDDLLKYSGQYIQEAVMGSGKIHFGLSTLYANEPERFMKVKDQILEVSVLEYLQAQLIAFITQEVQAKHLHPVVPLEDILAFMISAINGIAHNAILAYNLTEDNRMHPAPNIVPLLKTLSLAVRKLLGARDD